MFGYEYVIFVYVVVLPPVSRKSAVATYVRVSVNNNFMNEIIINAIVHYICKYSHSPITGPIMI